MFTSLISVVRNDVLGIKGTAIKSADFGLIGVRNDNLGIPYLNRLVKQGGLNGVRNDSLGISAGYQAERGMQLLSEKISLKSMMLIRL